MAENKPLWQWLEEAEEVSDYKGKKEVVCPKCFLTSCDCDERVRNIADTCCGKCTGGTCYVDQVTGA